MSDIVALLLEDLLGIIAMSGADLVVLEAYELMLRHIVACSGAMMQPTASRRSLPMNKFFLSRIRGLAMVAR